MKKSLKKYNTFGIEANCKRFIEITDIEALKNVDFTEKHLLLGGGSNMLILDDLDYTIIHLVNKGIEIREEYENGLIIECAAGENWHDLVLWSIRNGYGGIENLSLIPGQVGAAPIQNIGAYGVELKDVFVDAKVLDKQTGMVEYIDNKACQFGYRDSIFKSSKQGRYIILNIALKLTTNIHCYNIGYGAIADELEKQGTQNPSPKDISDIIISIRRSKLPDPKELGNSGSFFKNPIVDKEKIKILEKQFEDLVFYPVDENAFKIPAAWLIEKCGWKGKTIGNVGVYDKHALILVNHGGATGKEILQFSQDIIESVNHKFEIILLPEVNVIS